MTTKAVMKTRIADELTRADLSQQIGYAIDDAIAAYQTERFYFNESRAITFSTVASQEFYTSADNAAIPDIMAIDSIGLVLGSTFDLLRRATNIELEELSDNGAASGQPFAYSFYEQQLRLYPVPSGVWTVRVSGHIKLSAPTSDDETGNAWMTDAERLIRSRAKFELCANDGTGDAQLMALMPRMKEMTADAFTQLKGRSARQSGTGIIRAMAF